MAKRTLLEELLDDRKTSDVSKSKLVEEKANHIISSAINLVNLIEESFDTEESEDLKKRLLLSVKNKDPRRFERGINKLKEQKK